MAGPRTLQAELQRLGELPLSQWPAPLKGYGYEFTLVDHPMINASAVPGGRIFVTTGLVGPLETEAALQAVLAHEIAHVESRHSYRSNKGTRTAEAIGGLLNVFSRTTGNQGVAEVGALATNGIGNVVLANGR
ncbi:MAG: M48 family metalloprotease [Acidobacteria bacterium]|nr:M48 family metalloprotease [Acidobacteriota bacterium]MYH28314.1 M48 family metalloprotease [Acidobacteriota bacterium]